MKSVRGLEKVFQNNKQSVVTVGVFDGVHKGHQRIISTVVKEAKKRKAQSVVITFEPHPQEVIKPGSHPPFLTSTALKEELIEELGIDIFVLIKFTPKISQLTPTQFVDEILLAKFNTECVIVGEDFKFGKDAVGDKDFLKSLGKTKSFDVIVIPHVYAGGRAISSTRIRRLLELGELEKVKGILGRYPRLIGTVVKGQGRGKILGAATANIVTMDKASVPGNGVYAGFVNLNHTKSLCVIDIGTSPTFKDKKRVIHVHILDFQEDIYGQEIEIEIYRKLREEIEFPNQESLAVQIKQDIDQVKQLYDNY